MKVGEVDWNGIKYNQDPTSSMNMIAIVPIIGMEDVYIKYSKYITYRETVDYINKRVQEHLAKEFD